MRVLQVSNIVSHHQLPLARELIKLVGQDNFRFAATAEPDVQRLRMGWGNGEGEPWILRAGEDQKERLEFEKWWDHADVVLCGDRRFGRMGDRLAKGKPCFYMSERWWKPPVGIGRLFSPAFLRMVREFRFVAENPLFHYLPMGPFAYRDISRLCSIQQRSWQWGYFTSLSSSKRPVGARSGMLKVLWLGRMLAWKRVDTLIRAAGLLSQSGVSVELTLIGDGPEKAKLLALAKQLLGDKCQFYPSIPASDVAGVMEGHHVYVLPSSAYEGWGAVVNEAMDSGCAVIASRDTGAAAAMIDHGINGFLFAPGRWRDLAAHLARLERDESLRQRVASEAKLQIENWSPSVAAHRFISVSESVLKGLPCPEFRGGPMAKVAGADFY